MGYNTKMDQVLPVYKPVGITSFDVIRSYKRAYFRGINPVKYKVGHGGTLDPFADGVLLLLLGQATKKMNELSALPKTYRAVAKLGAKSDTLDCTGVITSEVIMRDDPKLSDIVEVARKFVGEIEQEIPDYSATKIKGVPRYKLARRGEAMERKSKLVTIHTINIIRMQEFDGSNHRTEVEMEMTVSSGTYIRQLSYDIFKSLGIESYLESLTRTQVGEYKIEDCIKIKDFGSGEI